MPRLNFNIVSLMKIKNTINNVWINKYHQFYIIE